MLGVFFFCNLVQMFYTHPALMSITFVIFHDSFCSKKIKKEAASAPSLVVWYNCQRRSASNTSVQDGRHKKTWHLMPATLCKCVLTSLINNQTNFPVFSLICNIVTVLNLQPVLHRMFKNQPGFSFANFKSACIFSICSIIYPLVMNPTRLHRLTFVSFYTFKTAFPFKKSVCVHVRRK